MRKTEAGSVLRSDDGNERKRSDWGRDCSSQGLKLAAWYVR
jgi:hypothetical protein